MKFVKVKSIEEMTDREYARYMAEKNSADLAYIAMMADVDLSDDEEAGGIDHE